MSGDARCELRVVERAGPARRVVLRADAPDGTDLRVFGGYEGPELPDVLGDARLESPGGGRYRISATQGDFEFSAKSADAIAMRPSLFASLHRPFALGARDRVAARALLSLLGLPGGAKLLRLWHARRSR